MSETLGTLEVPQKTERTAVRGETVLRIPPANAMIAPRQFDRQCPGIPWEQVPVGIPVHGEQLEIIISLLHPSDGYNRRLKNQALRQRKAFARTGPTISPAFPEVPVPTVVPAPIRHLRLASRHRRTLSRRRTVGRIPIQRLRPTAELVPIRLLRQIVGLHPIQPLLRAVGLHPIQRLRQALGATPIQLHRQAEVLQQSLRSPLPREKVQVPAPARPGGAEKRLGDMGDMRIKTGHPWF